MMGGWDDMKIRDVIDTKNKWLCNSSILRKTVTIYIHIYWYTYACICILCDWQHTSFAKSSFMLIYYKNILKPFSSASYALSEGTINYNTSWFKLQDRFKDCMDFKCYREIMMLTHFTTVSLDLLQKMVPLW